MAVSRASDSPYRPAGEGREHASAPEDRTAARPRRTPADGERKQDAERSRRLLLDAAMEEFAAKGFAGARVQEIAARAGVNKQLINYYFENKAGLYEAVRRAWFAYRSEADQAGSPLGDVVVGYLHDALTDPRPLRLMAWHGLAQEGTAAPETAPEREDLSDVEARQSRGEIAHDLDPACLLLALMGAVAFPVVMPEVAERVVGVKVDDPVFEERYGAQLRAIVRHLAR